MMMPQPSPKVEKLAKKERTYLTEGARMQRHSKQENTENKELKIDVDDLRNRGWVRSKGGK